MASKTPPLDDWRAAFHKADNLPEEASAQQRRARGKLLESILRSMFAESGLDPRLSYRPRGEEIDGSIWLHGRTFLVEAKWTAEPQPASSIYQFRGKVDGKLVGTLGIFISVAGYSPDAVNALVAGKELNIVLFDGDDLRSIVAGHHTIEDSIIFKLRAAGDAGTPFVPLHALTRTQQVATRSLVVVESRSEARALETLRARYKGNPSVTVVASGGYGNMLPVVDALTEEDPGIERVTLVLSEDAAATSEITDLVTVTEAKRASPHLRWEAITVAPSLRYALGIAPSEEFRESQRESRSREDLSLLSIDLAAVIASFPTVKRVLRRAGIFVPNAWSPVVASDA
ncbi:restriction endonuclease [Micromonospora sp. DT81.3]|uniref:restriction endonuclease n=1 Tax=Micromonospora sp. DT81.3 TaxID=3416523 RepID=UPI003CF870DB